MKNQNTLNPTQKGLFCIFLSWGFTLHKHYGKLKLIPPPAARPRRPPTSDHRRHRYILFRLRLCFFVKRIRVY
ncbi:hypothetical protein P3S68_004871 [Capsicum galapagoense]